MNSDFSVPQRQAKIGVILMFLGTIKEFVRAFWVLLVVIILKWNTEKGIIVIYIFSVFVIAMGIISYLKYFNFTFFIDEDKGEFVVNEGIINKTKTVIQLDKIQQVNINQSFVQQLVRVHSLEIEMAGSESKEVAIKAIIHDLAVQLKAKLIHGERMVSTTLENPLIAKHDVSEPFIKIGFWSLFKIGVTSNYFRSIGLILASFLAIYENANRFLDDSDYEKASSRVTNYVEENYAFNTLLLVLVFVFLAILILNLIRTLVRYYGFRITRQKETLVLNYGLINIKNSIVKPTRVQLTTVSRNYFQKKLDIFEMSVKQAVNGENDHRKTEIAIPGCNENEKNDMLQLFYNELPVKGLMLKPNYRKLVFSIFLIIVIPLALFSIVGSQMDYKIFEYSYVTLAYALIMLLFLIIGYRNYRIYFDENYIIKKSGVWDIDYEIIQTEKIQAITVSQLFWHKNLNIGSVKIDTAGGSVSFFLGNFDTIKDYVNLWLYKIENSDSNWM